MKISGSHTVVTGASSGIGRAIAIELATRGARLTLASRNEGGLESTAARCREASQDVQVIVTDVTVSSQCETLMAQAIDGFGEIDLLVSAAGFADLGPAEATRAEVVDGMLQTNFLGAVRCTTPLLPRFREREHGGLVFVSSILGIMGTEGMSGYAASKFALNGWAEALRDEVLGHGVFVTLICPGTTETPFFDRADRTNIPAASALLPTLTAEKVAMATADAIERESWRVILPFRARLFMRLREIAPRTAHFLMRHVSRLIKRSSS